MRYTNTRWKEVYKLCFLLVLSMTTLQRFNQDANDLKNINGSGNKQISDINMLLPVSNCDDCRKVSYQISAINGCFTW